VNCAYYTDLEKQAYRLAKKEYDFTDWYSDYFREDVQMGFMGNG